jgi:Cu/Ag efflux protein CusF
MSKHPLGAAVLAATLVALSVNAHAQSQGTDHASHHAPAAAPASQGVDFVQGEVRRVDLEAKKVTLRHGPIPNLQMPDMTMVFQVQDPTVLQGLKVGDKVRFKADKVDGTYVVTAVEPNR